MRSALLIMITCTSCTLPRETAHQLRVEPAAIAMDVDLAAPAPAVDPTTEVPTGAAAVRSDGSGQIVELTTDPLDKNARWASPVVNGQVWIAFVSQRPVGALAAGTQHLWLEQLDTTTGALSPAIHLRGKVT